METSVREEKKNETVSGQGRTAEAGETVVVERIGTRDLGQP
jgi:hypothetical protein